MHKKIFICIIIILQISCKNGFKNELVEKFRYKGSLKYKIILNEKNYYKLFNYNYFQRNNWVYTFEGKKKYAAKIYKFNKKFKIKPLKKIEKGRGPNEARNIDGFFCLKNYFYLYDAVLNRFLKYNHKFEYKETININKPLHISCFLKISNKIKGIGYEPDDYLYIYDIQFNKGYVKIRQKYKIKHKNTTKNDFLKVARMGIKKVYNRDKNIVLQTFDGVFFFEKNKQKKELKLRKHILLPSILKIRENNQEISQSDIIAVDKKNNLLFKYENDYFIYDYKNERKYKIQKPAFERMLNYFGERYWVYKDSKKEKYYLKYEVE